MAGMVDNSARDITSQDGLDKGDKRSLSLAAMETDALIAGLAKDLGVKDAALKKWRQRGVPHRWRLPLLREAARRGVTLPDEAFERQVAA